MKTAVIITSLSLFICCSGYAQAIFGDPPNKKEKLERNKKNYETIKKWTARRESDFGHMASFSPNRKVTLTERSKYGRQKYEGQVLKRPDDQARAYAGQEVKQDGYLYTALGKGTNTKYFTSGYINEIYEGNWLAGYMHGSGTLTKNALSKNTPDKTYTGTWKMGYKH